MAFFVGIGFAYSNSHDKLLIDGQLGDISMLKNMVIDFMTPHPNDASYPEVKEKHIDELGIDIDASQGLISLKSDRGTSCNMYIAVQNELASAFNEMKDKLSFRLFGVKYSLIYRKFQISKNN